MPLKTFGEVRGLDSLVAPHWAATEDDGWNMSAVAAELLDAQAVYRAPMDHLHVFFALFGLRESA